MPFTGQVILPAQNNNLMQKFNTLHLSKKLLVSIALLQMLFIKMKAQSLLPRPDHVVVLIMENHGYEDIIGNAAAPYINSLAQENALLTASYGLIHPSQPNYIMLYSGSNQGVTNNNVPAGIPWSTPNLGASLLQAGLTFKAYSDGLPSVGFTGTSSGAYQKKHAPWTNFQGTGNNQVPSTKHRPFTDFPTNFSNLPTVSFVVPDQNHDMHDGTVADGDAWVENNLGAYVTWSKTHNSLFILTFDEDDGDNLNHVVTLFAGEMVEPGNYNTTYNHYDLLRTIEEMYALPYAGNSATATTITDVWKADNTTFINEASSKVSLSVTPNPVSVFARVEISGVTDFNNCTFIIYDVLGNVVQDLSQEMMLHHGNFVFQRKDTRNGIYFYRFTNGKEKVQTGKIVVGD
jgi:hypothetical protein